MRGRFAPRALEDCAPASLDHRPREHLLMIRSRSRRGLRQRAAAQLGRYRAGKSAERRDLKTESVKSFDEV